MDGIQIRAGKSNIVVEKLLENVVVDRYTTDDLANPPKRLASWMQPVVEAGVAAKRDKSNGKPQLWAKPDAYVAAMREPNVFERIEQLQRARISDSEIIDRLMCENDRLRKGKKKPDDADEEETIG